ncbi:MAG: hypothetical protein WC461_00940 [Candidatus Paceibacterota bacterium]
MPDKLQHNKKEAGGYLLIESMIGISIAVVGLLGVLALLSHSIGLNRVIGNQLIANYLAAEGIEISKNIIDSNTIQGNPWNQGLDMDGKFEADYSSVNLEPSQNRKLLFDDISNFYGYTNGSQSPFTRIISVYPVSPDEVKIDSTVSWTDRGSAKLQVTMEDYFFNWR